MLKMKPITRILLLLVAAILVFVGQGCEREYATEHTGSAYDSDGYSRSDRRIEKKMLKVRVESEELAPDISSSHISNVSKELAIAKAYQGMSNYDHALAKKIGYNFPLSTVWQPDPNHFTRQMIDGHLWWVSILGFKNTNNQGAYNQVKGIIPGIVVIDAEDETKPAQIRLTDAEGNPYKIQLHYRNRNKDPNFIGRFLRDNGHGQPTEFYILTTGKGAYLDDVTPEVEDGTWRVYYTCTRNRNQIKVHKGWSCPKVEAVMTIDAENKKVKEYKPNDPNIPKWIDRIYSHDLVVQYINGWGFNTDNFKVRSAKGQLVLDKNQLDVVVNAKGDGLVYVGVMTSTQNDNSTTGLIIIPTRNLNGAKYYPLEGTRAIATRQQALDVFTKANEYREWKVEDLTIQWLYGRLTWECSYVKPIKFTTQEHGDSEEGEGDSTEIDGSILMAIALTPADCDMCPAKVVWDEKKVAAFAKYENLCFISQTSNVGSFALEENEADGHINTIQQIVAKGDTAYVFTIKEKPNMVFMAMILGLYDRDTAEILGAKPGDHVRFKYGDTKNSPTCFVKRFHDLTQNVYKSQ